MGGLTCFYLPDQTAPDACMRRIRLFKWQTCIKWIQNLFFLLLNLKGETKHKQWMSEEHTYKCKDGISPLMWGGVGDTNNFPNTCHSFQESAGIWMTGETWCLCVHDSHPPLSVWVTVAAQSHAISQLVTNLLQKTVIKGAIPLCNLFITGIWHQGIFDLFSPLH